MAGRLAAELEDHGYQVVVARGGGVETTQVLADFVASAIGADVMVPHSNAGRFGPAVLTGVGAKLTVPNASQG